MCYFSLVTKNLNQVENEFNRLHLFVFYFEYGTCCYYSTNIHPYHETRNSNFEVNSGKVLIYVQLMAGGFNFTEQRDGADSKNVL